MPLTATMRSPGSIPARSATAPLMSCPITGVGCSLCTPNTKATPKNSASATMKFAIGPATTIASRWSGRFAWKLSASSAPAAARNSRCCSASVDFPSSPFIWQYPPIGNTFQR